MKSPLPALALAMLAATGPVHAEPVLPEPPEGAVSVESRLVPGRCAPMPVLKNLIEANDGVTKTEKVVCDHAVYSPPHDAVGDDAGDVREAEANMFAFVDSRSGRYVALRGQWNDGDFDVAQISFDQESWFDAEKGRVRIYGHDDNGSIMMVVFAVYADGGAKKGVAFRMDAGS